MGFLISLESGVVSLTMFEKKHTGYQIYTNLRVYEPPKDDKEKYLYNVEKKSY